MIPLFKVAMNPEADKAVSKVLQSGFIGQGEVVEEFERQLKKRFKNEYLVTVNSGTSALQLALKLIKDKYPGKKYIISTPLTCTATNWAILAAGFEIIWADIEPNTLNIHPLSVQQCQTPEVAAVMVVHWGGAALDNAKSKFGFRPFVIEDCAHAFGSTYQGRKLGYNNFAAYSFQAIKHLTTGDGGALICPNEYFHQKAKLLRWYGLDRTTKADFRCEQMIQEAGFKFHMNDIAAAIGIENFQEMDWVITRHKENAKYIRENLKNVRLTESAHDRESAEWIFTIFVENRDRFVKLMTDKGIAVSRVHDRNDKHPCFKKYSDYLPQTTQVCETMICLPCGWWLEQEDLEYIVQIVNGGW